MSGELRVRRYQPTDDAAVRRVHGAATGGPTAPSRPPVGAAPHDAEWVSRHHGEFLLGEVPTACRAVAGPEPSDRRGGWLVVATGGIRPSGPSAAALTCLCVHPQHRGRGFDRRLVDGLERAARSRGFERVVLDPEGPTSAVDDTAPESFGHEAAPGTADEARSRCYARLL